MPDEPDPDRVQDAAERRQHERAETVEDVLDAAGALEGFDDLDYPIRGEELAVEYGDREIDLPNETESLGSVFDRLIDEQFDSPAEVREAVYDELTGRAGGPEEYNDERPLDELPGHEGSDAG